MSFVGELKRRNVVRVGVAYAVIGWVLAQIAEFAFENFGAPEWVLKTFVVSILLGLPIALVFAWAFEVTPEGIKREKHVDRSASITTTTGRKIDYLIIAVLLVAVTILAIDKLGNGGTGLEEAATDQSIAVLPFVNMSDDTDYFADGLTEELLNLLAKNSDLKVAGRTSSFAFKGQNDDLRAIGDALGVAKVLEGSVRRSGIKLRVTAQLINVEDGFHIWSETYDRELADVFDIQDEVAGAITQALKLHLTPAADRLTENAEAYAKYVQAVALSNFDGDDDIPRGIDLLEQAVALDPFFAKAYELKALFHWMNAGYTVEAALGQQQVFASASRALELDPSLAGARSLVKTSDASNWSWIIEIEALEELVATERTVRRLDTYAYDLCTVGYFSEAEAIYREILAIDPLSSNAIYRLGRSLAMQGRFDEAKLLWHKAAGLGLDFARWDLVMASLIQGEDQQAATHMALITAFPVALEDFPDEISFIRAMRDPESGKASLDAWVAKQEEAASSMNDARGAYDLYLAFGYLDEFAALADRFNVPGPVWTDGEDMESFGMTFDREGFVAHRSFMPRAKALGLFDLWDTRGAPDHCSKEGGEWVCR
jgi:TolB-like protein